MYLEVENSVSGGPTLLTAVAVIAWTVRQFPVVAAFEEIASFSFVFGYLWFGANAFNRRFLLVCGEQSDERGNGWSVGAHRLVGSTEPFVAHFWRHFLRADAIRLRPKTTSRKQSSDHLTPNIFTESRVMAIGWVESNNGPNRWQSERTSIASIGDEVLTICWQQTNACEPSFPQTTQLAVWADLNWFRIALAKQNTLYDVSHPLEGRHWHIIGLKHNQHNQHNQHNHGHFIYWFITNQAMNGYYLYV